MYLCICKFILSLTIVCVSNKCMQLYTYVSTIWHHMVIGQLQGIYYFSI